MTDRKHVYIFMPTYTGHPRIETLFALMDLQNGLSEEGWRASWKFTVGDSIIPRSRNMAVADCLAKGCSDLVMLDDDLEWEPGAVIRLLKHPCDVVGGVYPKRQETLEFPAKRLPGAEPDKKTGLVEMKALPTGFLRMSRNCLQTMVQAYGAELAYQEECLPSRIAWCLFWFELCPDPERPDGAKQLWGEDFTFSRRWRALGGKLYADTLLTFKHYGKKAYTGAYAEAFPEFYAWLNRAEAKSAA